MKYWLSVAVLTVAFAPMVLAESLSAVDVLLDARQIDQAETTLSTISDISAGDRARYRSVIEQHRGNFEAASEHAQLAVDSERSALNLSTLGDSLGQQAGQASMFKAMGLAKKAKRAWEDALSLDPDLISARQALLQFHLQAPGVAGGDKDEAKRQAEEITARDRGAGLQAQMAVAQATEKTDEAISIGEQMVKEFPDQLNGHMQLAALYQNSGRYSDAVATLQTAIQQKDDFWRAHYLLGRGAALSGQYLEEGQAGLQRFLADAEPNEVWRVAANWRLAMVQEHAGNIAAAMASVDRALALDPKHKESRRLKKKLKRAL